MSLARYETDDTADDGSSDISDDSSVGGDGKLGLRDFVVLAVLGRGGYGKVLLVRHLASGQLYAMKTLHKKAVIARKQVLRTMTEKEILARVKHPFIVNLAFAFQSRAKLYMVMEYVEGGDLFTLLSTRGLASAPRAQLYMAEMVLALGHLHSLGIVYRDLKPENILLDAEGHIKLTDFGLSRLSDSAAGEVAPGVAEAVASAEQAADQATYSFCGTEQYMAPEMLLQQGAGATADWFSLGIVLSEMMTGQHPFRGGTHLDTLRNMVNPRVPPATLSMLPPPAAALLGELCQVDPAKRLGSTARGGLQSVQNHVFFSGLNWDAVAERGVQPQYVPQLRGAADTSHFDRLFTREAPVDSTASSVGPGVDPTHFAGLFKQLPFAEAAQHPRGSDGAPDRASRSSSADTWNFPGFSFVDADALGDAVADAVDAVMAAEGGRAEP